MNVFFGNIQDSIVVKDTAKTIKAAKILPAAKINSEEGAIIPKEAISMIKLQPSMPLEQKEDTPVLTYVMIGVVLIIVFILVRIVLKKIKASRETK
ncbi:hypothetical protein [Snuella sedimenti]|uniref:Uncharacterized protein n=1 Tax=Snuella sedimenti TaxID=2798802 RepID=A0A8J7LMA5_9FLAO|nr:hypothetical protein [Snuella sedimenti]MBJ6367284.1 hypothetical protein [Snuella sedimenti]